MELFSSCDLTTYISNVLTSVSVPETDARTTADCLVTSNLRGVDTHGVRLLPIYVRRLQLGVMEARPQLQVVREGTAFAAIDGGNAMGPVAGAYAMDKAMALARGAGVAAVTVRNSNHFGAAGWYALRAMAEGMVGIATTNGTPALAPWGGRMPFFGANPLAVAVPSDSESSIVLDMATSVTARARIRQYAARGESIPEGWAIDRQGRATKDPAEALQGALLPVGGVKGYGIVLALEVLAGALTGAGFSPENRDLYGDLTGPQGLGHFFLVINPKAFLPDGSFPQRVDRLVRDLHSAPTAEGTDRVKVPGELESECQQRRLSEGVPLPPEQVEELTALGRRLGVTFPQSIGSC